MQNAQLSTIVCCPYKLQLGVNRYEYEWIVNQEGSVQSLSALVNKIEWEMCWVSDDFHPSRTRHKCTEKYEEIYKFPNKKINKQSGKNSLYTFENIFKDIIVFVLQFGLFIIYRS